ncbi:MAG: exodeoxyribonuclease VII large subunit [Patescibacteria group bacterium]|jgi:exodeoxyribonuclease VII large subunit
MTVYSVSEFVSGVNELLSGIPTCVQGEVSNFHVAQNRFVWFDLKDEKSAVSCFMLAFQLNQIIADGMLIQVTGNPALFSKSGRFHIRAHTIQLVGAGSLKQQYELLKKKLANEGLFDAARKRQLPRFPQTIGLVTSPDAAAYTDVLKILRHRWPNLQIKLFPVNVQGAQAPASIIQALQLINKNWVNKLDVAIITRGGGSMEDLQAFNDEAVVRAIFGLQVPCIVGVGHERDETLAEFVADIRASTPSNAAELAVPHVADVQAQITHLVTQQQHYLQQKLASSIHTVTQDFLDQVNYWQQTIKQKLSAVQHAKQLLLSYHPKNILARGYSITTLTNGTVITSAKQLKLKTPITTTFASGKISSTVLKFWH